MLVEVRRRSAPAPRIHVIGPQREFVSPIDGTHITRKDQLKDHMDKYGVVRPGDFGANEGKEYFERKAKERADYYTDSPRLRKEIRKDLEKSIQQHIDKGES